MINPGARGYSAVYREHEINHCPGCGHTHWVIGRTTAECAFCSTALSLADGLNALTPKPFIIARGRGGGRVHGSWTARERKSHAHLHDHHQGRA